MSSTTILSLRNALGVPPTRVPIDSTTFVSYVLPPVIFYLALAVLAVKPRTHTIRVALWPLIALLALRASLSVDMSRNNPKYTLFDTTFVHLMSAGAIRSISWTFSKEPLVRHLRPRNSPPSTIMDALDLAWAFRGHGWEWSHRLYIPRETRPADPVAFVFRVFLSVVAHALICGVFHQATLSFVVGGAITISKGSTLFDETLPLLVRYFRASIITIFIAITSYAAMQLGYDLCTIFAILFLGQDPSQWPPAFDAPWCATSLADFWGRRWHQFLRQIFLLIGGYPLSWVLGSTGIVIGSFLASALMHHINLRMLDSEADIRWMLVGFGMMAPGILAERVFHRLTGKQVGGVVGWVWTMAWLVLWGNVIYEGFARAPMHDRSTLIDGLTPVRVLVERTVTGFDEWLHTI